MKEILSMYPIDPKKASAACYPPMVPKILSAPKIASCQHYLTSDSSPDKRTPNTYTDEAGCKGTRIRGHKMYWHRWPRSKGLSTLVSLKKTQKADPERITQDLLSDPVGNATKYTQYTVIQPVREGTNFRSKIRFENLTELELGALLSAINLPEGCHHRIGMGKPLGLGRRYSDGLVTGSLRLHSLTSTPTNR